MKAKPIIPVATYNERGEPEWEALLPVTITRMDHSLGLTQHAGTIKKGEIRIADVSMALGGFAYIVHPVKYKGKGSGSFALELRGTIEFVMSMIPLMGQVEEGTWPQKKVVDELNANTVRRLFTVARHTGAIRRSDARKELLRLKLIERKGTGIRMHYELSNMGARFTEQNRINPSLHAPGLGLFKHNRKRRKKR